MPLFAIFSILFGHTPPRHEASPPTAIDAAAFGVRGDGKTDCTAALQRALNAAESRHAPELRLGSGNFLVKGSLKVPEGVAIVGTWISVPSHNGLRDAGLPKPTERGTTFLVEGGEGGDKGAFLTLMTDATVRGIVFYYPNQPHQGPPVKYPWTIAMRGENPAVLECELLNPWNGIDASQNERHLIRDVSGQPLHIGVFVDAVYDIGRIEDVHFNPWWSVAPGVLDWQQAHGTGFLFGRSDWEYVLNTFCFGYAIGYRFVKTSNGDCNGNFLGIGADGCSNSLRVDASAPYGLLITNGEFVATASNNPTMIDVTASNTGTLSLSNCAFWGPCRHVAKLAGGRVLFNGCVFSQWDAKNQGLAAIKATGGSLVVNGCSFQQPKAILQQSKTANVVMGENLTLKPRS